MYPFLDIGPSSKRELSLEVWVRLHDLDERGSGWIFGGAVTFALGSFQSFFGFYCNFYNFLLTF